MLNRGSVLALIYGTLRVQAIRAGMVVYCMFSRDEKKTGQAFEELLGSRFATCLLFRSNNALECFPLFLSLLLMLHITASFPLSSELVLLWFMSPAFASVWLA
jgi:hypothetical protein